MCSADFLPCFGALKSDKGAQQRIYFDFAGCVPTFWHEADILMDEKKLRFALISVTVGLVVSLAWWWWPRHTKGPVLRLGIVKNTQEQGKPVVFFRIDVADNRRLRLEFVERIVGERIEGPLMWVSGPKPITSPGFWAPSQKSILHELTRGPVEFAVLAPTNAPVWKLRVAVDLETPQRWKAVWRRWKSLRRFGKSVSSATSEALGTFYRDVHEVLDSELVTNSPPH